jgi:hypothetical protein
MNRKVELKVVAGFESARGHDKPAPAERPQHRREHHQAKAQHRQPKAQHHQPRPQALVEQPQPAQLQYPRSVSRG